LNIFVTKIKNRRNIASVVEIMMTMHVNRTKGH